jgi:transposase InsO family protein
VSVRTACKWLARWRAGGARAPHDRSSAPAGCRPLRAWAYARPYVSSLERSQAIDPWLHHYNHHRPHAGIHGTTPTARLNNLLGNDS